MKNLVYVFVLTVLLAGCKSEPEKHEVHSSGETGVEIKVLLEGGGTATLVCPKHNSKPIGSHGRECYIREYNYEM